MLSLIGPQSPPVELLAKEEAILDNPEAKHLSIESPKHLYCNGGANVPIINVVSPSHSQKFN